MSQRGLKLRTGPGPLLILPNVVPQSTFLSLRMQTASLTHERMPLDDGSLLDRGYVRRCEDNETFDIRSAVYEAMRGLATQVGSELLRNPIRLESWKLAAGNAWPTNIAHPEEDVRFRFMLFLHKEWAANHGGIVTFRSPDSRGLVHVLPRPNMIVITRLQSTMQPRIRPVTRDGSAYALLHWYT